MNEIVLSPEQLSILIGKFENFKSATPELVEKALRPIELPQLSVPETDADTYEDASEEWSVTNYDDEEEKAALRKCLELVENSVAEEFYDSIEEALLDFYSDYEDGNHQDCEIERILIIRAMAEKVVLAA